MYMGVRVGARVLVGFLVGEAVAPRVGLRVGARVVVGQVGAWVSKHLSLYTLFPRVDRENVQE